MRLRKSFFQGLTDKSVHDIHFETRLSYSHIHRYMRGDIENITQVRLDALHTLLTKGLGLDLSELRFLDVFSEEPSESP